MLFRPLLPPEISLAEAPLRDFNGHQMPEPPLHPEEEALAARMKGARADEFRAGRHLIRRLMLDCGSPTPPPVLPDAEGAPIWPTGFRGSITHHADRVAVALSAIERCQEFGIDLVSLADSLPPEDFLHPGEKRRFSAAATELGRVQRHLAWGVKEAAAKALGTKLFPLDRFAEAETETNHHGLLLTPEMIKGRVAVSARGPCLDFRARCHGPLLAVVAEVPR